MSQLYSNNAITALTAAITASATTLTVANGAVLPALTAGDYFLVTLIGLNANGAEDKWEIVKVTARSSNTLTVVRGQEGTTAQAWANGTLVEARLTAGTLANLVEKVAGKQLSTEDFTSALLAKLNAAAPLASPAFTGNPTAPTPAVADNDTSIATTAFVKAALAALVDSSPAALDTLNELAAALGDDPNFAATMATELGKKLDATSYTAADVLAKLKTVDGAGSGIDADLLDGQDSAFYRSASNLNAGTVPDARLSGTYTGVSITGNAATATRLQTARTIGGVSFDGSANINLPGVNSVGNQNTTGNAATATKLQTPRTINGVPFDGTANITIKSNLAQLNQSGAAVDQVPVWNGTAWVPGDMEGGGGQEIGDVMITARTPDASYLPATGNIYMQSAYPELFGEVGLIGGDVALAWEHVANGLTSFVINDVAMGDDGVCIAVSNGAFYRSTDNGLTWSIYSDPSLKQQAQKIETDGNGVWVALHVYGTGVFCSTSVDNGITWGAEVAVARTTGMTALAFKTDRNGTWVASLSSGRPAISTNNGQTWSAAGSGPSSITATAIETDGNGYWIFGTGSGQVFQANAGSWTYTALATGFPSQGISGIATDRNGVWIINGGSHVTRSFNDRVTWETVTGTSLAGNGKLVTNGRGVWLSAHTSSIIRRSLDNGLSWENLTVPGAPSGAFNGVACAGDYFVAVGNAGLFAASEPAYGYDTTTQFRLPKLPAPAGLSAYIKGSNV